MPTKSEAAEALYRAASTVSDEVLLGQISRLSGTTQRGRDALDALTEAVAAYRDATPSTPDPLPAEVQRVLEAAEAFERRWIGPVLFSDCVSEGRDVVEAIRAYRSSQPEPLSARLARLRPGAVITEEANSFVVLANIVEHQTLVVLHRERVNLLRYSDVDSILSESP